MTLTVSGSSAARGRAVASQGTRNHEALHMSKIVATSSLTLGDKQAAVLVRVQDLEGHDTLATLLWVVFTGVPVKLSTNA